MSKITIGERVEFIEPRLLTRVTLEYRRIVEIWLEPTNISGGIFEDDWNSNTCLLGNVWRNLIFHEYSNNVSVFSYYIGVLELPITDAEIVLKKEDEDEVIIRINQELSKKIWIIFVNANIQSTIH